MTGTPTPYFRGVICGSPERLDGVMVALTPREIRIVGANTDYRQARTLEFNGQMVGQYAPNRDFPYSAAIALDPRFQEITGLDPNTILEIYTKEFRG